jgi:hypothetical protein
VVGGLGVRFELTFEQLEDLQVALGALLDCCADDSVITIRVARDGGAVRLAVGPFDAGMLADELDREPADGPSVERVLAAVVDKVERVEREDGTWVELTTQLEPVHG